MKTAVTRAAPALGLALMLACAGTATMPDVEPTPQDQAHRGYGVQPDEKVAGAVETLESEKESGGHFATMVDMLRGRVAGLQISESASGEISVRIRGDQSIYFNKPPLLVVDGVQVPSYSFSSTLRTMNPRDVASIQVLKDTGSTSIYGSRGAHGVIIIRLKRR
jgi:TonB-dependent SusC/RagA subfamily outer membrane receptor